MDMLPCYQIMPFIACAWRVPAAGLQVYANFGTTRAQMLCGDTRRKRMSKDTDPHPGGIVPPLLIDPWSMCCSDCVNAMQQPLWRAPRDRTISTTSDTPCSALSHRTACPALPIRIIFHHPLLDSAGASPVARISCCSPGAGRPRPCTGCSFASRYTAGRRRCAPRLTRTRLCCYFRYVIPIHRQHREPCANAGGFLSPCCRWRYVIVT